MKRKPSPIGEVLETVVARLESQKNFSREEIEAHWRATAGETAFKHSRPTALKRKILTVRVDNSVWMQELSFQKRRLLKELKRALGKDRISGLHFKMGEF